MMFNNDIKAAVAITRIKQLTNAFETTLMMPGQFGPISRVLFCLTSLCFTRTISCCGIPSVMHTAKLISASIASIIAAAANGGGTNITVAVAPVPSTAYENYEQINLLFTIN